MRLLRSIQRDEEIGKEQRVIYAVSEITVDSQYVRSRIYHTETEYTGAKNQCLTAQLELMRTLIKTKPSRRKTRSLGKPQMKPDLLQ